MSIRSESAFCHATIGTYSLPYLPAYLCLPTFNLDWLILPQTFLPRKVHTNVAVTAYELSCLQEGRLTTLLLFVYFYHSLLYHYCPPHAVYQLPAVNPPAQLLSMLQLLYKRLTYTSSQSVSLPDVLIHLTVKRKISVCRKNSRSLLDSECAAIVVVDAAV